MQFTGTIWSFAEITSPAVEPGDTMRVCKLFNCRPGNKRKKINYNKRFLIFKATTMHGQQSGAVSIPGQDAFGAIQEVVQILQADASTDWSKVNIAALRQHLIDMNEVTLRAVATERLLDNGIEIAVTGEGRTLEAIKRMVPAHVNELREIGWNAKSEDLANGVKLTVMASGAQPLAKLKALGFMGIMVQGAHHQPHHLMMAKGEFSMH